MSGGWDQDDDFAAMLRRVNPDDPILRHIQARRIREHLVSAAGADPSQAARALDLAARAGVPFDVAERNLAQTRARAGADRYAEAMAGSPALGPWIARDPVNARIARHDYDNLGLIDQAWTAFARGGRGAGQAPTDAAARPHADPPDAVDSSARRAAFSALGDRVAGLTMARLSPEKTEDVVRAIVGQGGPRAVLIPVRDMQGHLGSLPPTEAEARAHAWGVDELLRQDVNAEGDLVSPTELYLTRLHPQAGKDIGRNLRFAEPRSMGDCLANCAKKFAGGDHYPWQTDLARDASYLGSMPVKKKWFGQRVEKGASTWTNPISELRFLFPPNKDHKRLRLPKSVLGVPLPRRIMGTTSVLGLVGRANPYVATALAGYDAVQFGGCMGDCLGNPKPEDIEVPPHA